MSTKAKQAIHDSKIFNQRKLARHLDVPESTMSKYLSGELEIPDEIKTRMAIALGFRITNELFPEE